MTKNPLSQSRLFTFRGLLTFTLCFLALSLAYLSFAGTARTAQRSPSSTHSSSAAPPPDTPPPTPSGPGIPRYYNYAPPPGLGEAAGEPPIWFNPGPHRLTT